MNSPVARELRQLALDVLICLVLFVVACAFAGAVQQFIFPNIDWLYIVWFAIGMLPVVFYARYRGVCNFDKWDVVAFSPFPLVIAGVDALIPNQISPLIAAFVMVYVGGFIRRFLPARSGG
ncbi:hypothetical protein Poly51_39870 [Rubripirellula tenax]|uniref:Uncharacterized protein n=1 Tax=Rubripirellula tenax TaxID=2528015 RepID=A0A5C6EQP3_9BACT|nr:hypothetical protein [Rubripirellula tenax]TWU50694.1 hypothetical protein Poly51_39870 [Rubripirellula tenax]